MWCDSAAIFYSQPSSKTLRLLRGGMVQGSVRSPSEFKSFAVVRRPAFTLGWGYVWGYEASNPDEIGSICMNLDRQACPALGTTLKAGSIDPVSFQKPRIAGLLCFWGIYSFLFRPRHAYTF